MKIKLFASVAFAVLAALAPASAQNNFTLSSTLNSSVGVSSPAQVMAADVNGDGKPDLICSDTVFTNNGKGVFGRAFSLPTFFRSYGCVAADVNGDGRVDLVTLSNINLFPFTEGIVVYTNVGITPGGNVGFGVASTTPGMGHNTNLGGSFTIGGSLGAAGDVYGNGRSNLFYFNPYVSSLSLYTNNGGGAFGSNTTFSLKMSLPTVADFNRDDSVDFASCWYSNNIVYIFTNNGGGVLGSNASFSVKSPVTVVAADINGDGWADLICQSVTNGAATTNTITIWTNNESGVFGSNTSFTVGNGNQYVYDTKVAPLFGNGQAALVFAVGYEGSGQFNTLMVYTNNGAGGFGSNTAVNVGPNTQPESVAVADVNGDQSLDLISANETSGTLTVFTNTGSGIQSGGFLSNSAPVAGTNDYFVVAADIYRTGQPQLLVPNAAAGAPYPQSLLVLTNNGGGMFGSNAVVSGFAAANNYLEGAPVAADIFANGRPALIVGLASQNNTSGSLVILTNNGSGIFGTNSSISTGSLVPYQVVAADVNGDGQLDLIVAGAAQNSTLLNLLVLTNNGSGGFATNVTLTIAGASSAQVAVADVNNDGRPDLITATGANGSAGKLTVYTNLSATGFGPLYSFLTSVTYAVGVNPVALVAADVNGDGRVDFITANDNTNGTLTVMTNSGFNNNPFNSYTFGLASSPVTGPLPHALTAADVNGDGKVDLISANWGLTTNTTLDQRGPLGYGTLTVLTNNGAGGFTNPATYSTGPGPMAVTALDVNGDGQPDLIVANYTSFTNFSSQPVVYGLGNTLSILLNTSNFVNTVALQTAPGNSPITYGQSLSVAGLTGGTVTNQAGTAVTGGFAYTTNSVLGAGVMNPPVIFTPAAPTDYQPFTFKESVTVNPLVAILKGKRAYDGTTNVVFGILSVSNKVGSDNVIVSAGSIGLASANSGTNSITSTNGLTLGGSTATNYTLSGISGSVTITQAVNAVVLTSSQNPSARGASVNFTATLPAYAGGTVQFLTNGANFDLESLTAGSAGSVATTSLPVGSNTITAAYSGDPNDRAVTNSLGQLVMAPQFNTIASGAGGLILSGSWGASNATYYLYDSTDVSLPLSQWTPVLTNQFDNNGNFNLTNALTPAPAVFYILETP